MSAVSHEHNQMNVVNSR